MSCPFLSPCHCSSSLCACTALSTWQVPSQWKQTINKHFPLHDLRNMAHIFPLALTAHDILNEQRSCVSFVIVTALNTNIVSIWGARIHRGFWDWSLLRGWGRKRNPTWLPTSWLGNWMDGGAIHRDREKQGKQVGPRQDGWMMTSPGKGESCVYALSLWVN